MICSDRWVRFAYTDQALKCSVRGCAEHYLEPAVQAGRDLILLEVQQKRIESLYRAYDSRSFRPKVTQTNQVGQRAAPCRCENLHDKDSVNNLSYS